MTSITTIAGHAGRISGTAARLTRQIDWREVFTIVVMGLVTTALLTYETGRLTGRFVHALNDTLAREWVAALGVLDMAPAPLDPRQAPLDPRQAPLDMAPAPLDPRPIVATTRHAMPTGIDHARHLVAAGHSQRQAARRAGVSRTSLQRALAVA